MPRPTKFPADCTASACSCVNALSEELDLEIWRDGFTWEQTYSKGEPTSKLKKAGATKKRGTKVHFLPDRTIFTATEYNFDTLSQRLRETGLPESRACSSRSPTSAPPTRRPARPSAPSSSTTAASPNSSST